MKRFWIISLLVLFALVWPASRVSGQESAPGSLVYIVQAGDSLWVVSLRFGVSLAELAAANNLTVESSLNIGDRLVIPGLEGMAGTLETQPVAYGDSLHSLSRRYQVPASVLVRLNRLTSPQELYVGSNLVMLSPEQPVEALGVRTGLAPGESALELAVQQGVNPWMLLRANQFTGSWQVMPGDVVYLPGGSTGGPGALPGVVSQVSFDMPVEQGDTLNVQLESAAGLEVQGSFMGYRLNFFSSSDGQYVALQGVHALAKPGIYPLSLQVTDAQGVTTAYSQLVQVSETGYPYDPVLLVDAATIDPQVTQPEDAQWIALAQPVTPEKLWEGPFLVPVAPEFAECWPSGYGNRRSYNDGPYNYFHTGLDFCGAVGNAILAPARGVVVFAGPLTVRGNATMIDHGWGIYTAYMHQSEILVNVGDEVLPGNEIGKVGNTGRVTGPHLHWEVWAGGVQVDPIYWLERAYP